MKIIYNKDRLEFPPVFTAYEIYSSGLSPEEFERKLFKQFLEDYNGCC